MTLSKFEIAIAVAFAMIAIVHSIFIGFVTSMAPGGSFVGFAMVAIWAYPIAWIVVTTMAIAFVRILEWSTRP